MGAGKTTLGKAFAREMSLNFIDLDWYIEERFHKTVQQLFLERGEDGFRELERKMLHEVAEFEDVVVSAGGGTPCFFDNMEYMNDCGDTVFLDVEPAVLFRRLRVAKQQRPLLANKSDEELTDIDNARGLLADDELSGHLLPCHIACGTTHCGRLHSLAGSHKGALRCPTAKHGAPWSC